MGTKEGQCRYQDCILKSLWGSAFCVIHRPGPDDEAVAAICAIAKWAGSAAAGAVLMHMLEALPHIGKIFTQHADLLAAIGNDPDIEIINRAVSIFAEAEHSMRSSVVVVSTSISLKVEAAKSPIVMGSIDFEGSDINERTNPGTKLQAITRAEAAETNS